jgi:hypothetical protein
MNVFLSNGIFIILYVRTIADSIQFIFSFGFILTFFHAMRTVIRLSTENVKKLPIGTKEIFRVLFCCFVDMIDSNVCF